MRPLAVGLGRGGGRILDWFLERVWDDVAPETLVMDVNPDHLAEVHAKETLLLGEEYTLDRDELLKPGWVGTLFHDQFDRIAPYLDDFEPVWIVTGLGGRFGTTTAPILARKTQEPEQQTFGVVSRPFDFEPDERLDCAERGERRLERYADEVFSLRLELILNYVEQNEVRPSELFTLSDQVMSNLLYFLMKSVVSGSQVEEEALDRLRNVNDFQRRNLILNALAPGWGQNSDEPRDKDHESEEVTPYLQRLKERISKRSN